MLSWSLWCPQVNSSPGSSGKNLSWGHYTEEALWEAGAVWQGENLDFYSGCP